MSKYKDLPLFKQKENSQKKMDKQTTRYEICDMKGEKYHRIKQEKICWGKKQMGKKI